MHVLKLMVKDKGFSVSLVLVIHQHPYNISSKTLPGSTSDPPTQGMNTVPLVPTSPAGSPVSATPKPPTIDISQSQEILRTHRTNPFRSRRQCILKAKTSLTNPVQTQAGDGSPRLQLNVTTYAGSRVSMATGAVNATVTVLVPLDFVLSKAKDPSPTNGVSPKSGETGSSAGGSGKSGSGDDVVPVDASSAGSVSLKKVEKILWMTIVLVLALGVTI
ncbi:hypothetical protein JHK82_037957 [Glycine max]|nr:hypothetical protein JHK85_038712 [Glycine max]KAG4978674.1 hypothetical protein JHK86_038148 [Glycine max]KAG5114688.1 hypothetical protein JHK82_037957 [Glycine max]KAG5131973.1 hypothetical protein JHK84_038370 [Glycine max]